MHRLFGHVTLACSSLTVFLSLYSNYVARMDIYDPLWTLTVVLLIAGHVLFASQSDILTLIRALF